MNSNFTINGKNVLITGAGGNVGSKISEYFESLGYSVCASGYASFGSKSYLLDVTKRDTVLKEIANSEPEIIIHAAAKSSLVECEKNPEIANSVNVNGTLNIIDAIKATNPEIKMIFLSSDYVFDGNRGNYVENDQANPFTVYGKTKLDAEKLIMKELDNYIICRSANIFGRGSNFFNFIVNHLEGMSSVEVFKDTFYTPTYIEYFVESLEILINSGFHGIIHIAGRERLSRYEFAIKVADAMKRERKFVIPIKQPDSGLIAKDNSLNTDFSRRILKNKCPSIEEALGDIFSK